MLLAAAAGFAVVWGLVGAARERWPLAGVVVAIAAVAPFFGIWLALSGLLPHADAPRRALFPGALLVALGMQVVHPGTVFFVAGRVERASATYGSFGVAFTLLVWLYFVGRIIVGSAMLNAALWDRSPGSARRTAARSPDRSATAASARP